MSLKIEKWRGSKLIEHGLRIVSWFSHGTFWIAEIIHWIISPNLRPHLRKISNMIWASLSLNLHNLAIAPRGDPKDDQVGDEKDGADAEGHDEDLATIDDTEDFENEADHMVGKGQMDKGKDEREEKDSPHLTVDGPFDLVFIEPHLLEDDEAVTVFIAFWD